jgi:GNAT superfamily N-acetyltransferase
MINIRPHVCIRELREEDCVQISQAFAKQGWNKPVQQYIRYFMDCREESRLVLIAEIEGQIAGYITVVWASDYPPFREAGIPEITDFNVLKKFQRCHIGTALMDVAEARIRQSVPIAGIGVCLTADYGPALILYVRRGYIPDGKGAFQEGKFLRYGDRAIVNDDLSIYLTKRLDIIP